ncbi:MULTISPECIES: response regulator [unclassified Polaribacter]|uniref:response regulator n=1 Tax=unclassified Polaribacter TaxID=196858 RepID=UPI0011BDF17C|nr:MULTISPECIES: response regulator [unclassified Polaribacter]TXD53111.1 response regulator transcription factor [Polaribacter sp. IC063]TXD61231.1 response regulator transcription factor [Polaribacter sp. IC066]
MIEKVLVVEDFDVINSGINSALEKMEIKQIDSVPYCDEAFYKIKNAAVIKEPYNLIISDLSFVNDGTPQKLKSGEELIAKIRTEFPDLKIIVFSVEDKPYRIQHLYHTLKIQGYVWKNRNGLKELKEAIHSVFTSNEFYISPELNSAVHPKKAIEITEFDVFLIASLSQGFLQEDISKKLKKKGTIPSSVSAVEKRLKILKEHFNAKNPAHLVAIAKDFGLI